QHTKRNRPSIDRHRRLRAFEIVVSFVDGAERTKDTEAFGRRSVCPIFPRPAATTFHRLLDDILGCRRQPAYLPSRGTPWRRRPPPRVFRGAGIRLRHALLFRVLVVWSIS